MPTTTTQSMWNRVYEVAIEAFVDGEWQGNWSKRIVLANSVTEAIRRAEEDENDVTNFEDVPVPMRAEAATLICVVDILPEDGGPD